MKNNFEFFSVREKKLETEIMQRGKNKVREKEREIDNDRREIPSEGER